MSDLLDGAVTPLLFRRVLGQFATGVTLIGVRHEGAPWAMTANAVASISLDPPIVMVSIAATALTHRAIESFGAFSVNILRTGQESLARRFSVRGGIDDPFADVDLIAGPTGAPIFAGSLGWIDCTVREASVQGDHTVFFGDVRALGEGEGDPLLYFGGQYGLIEPGHRDNGAADQWRVRLTSASPARVVR